MTILLAILALLAAGILAIGLLYALGARVPARALAIGAVAIAVAAGATLVWIVVRDMVA